MTEERGSKKGMHVTTIRFGDELWEVVSEEAARQGVSVAQYVREATVSRIAYARGSRDALLVEAARVRDELLADLGALE